MVVVVRARVPEDEGAAFRTSAEDLLILLAGRPGFQRGHVGRAVDDAGLWLFATEWDGVGSYRRALSAYDVKVAAPAVMAYAVTEPSAFEVLATR